VRALTGARLPASTDSAAATAGELEQRMGQAGGHSPGASPEQDAGACYGGDGVPKVSHGASEKQRRDRINSMIDQLRLLGALRPLCTRWLCGV
jgi:hypothetical protein